MLGSFVLSSGYYDAYYLKALRVKALIRQAFDRAFASYDLILGPAAPTTAPELGKSLGDPIKMYLGDIYTISVNLAGLPGMVVPVGKDSRGLPIGMQLIGNSFQEKTLLRAAYTYECATEKQFEAPADVRAAADRAAGSAKAENLSCPQLSGGTFMLEAEPQDRGCQIQKTGREA